MSAPSTQRPGAAPQAMLEGRRVVELEGAYGSDCARFLASLGAEVIKVVAPPDAAQGAQRLSRRALADLGKHTLELDPARVEDVLALRRLIQSADFLIESYAPGSLRHQGIADGQLAQLNPRLIHVSITAFGSVGPYSAYRGSELVASAMSGVLRSVGYRDRAPVKEALDACSFHACAAAAAGMLLAHYERAHSGLGQHVDVSLQEVGFSRNTVGVLLWQFDRRKLERSGCALRYGRASVRCVWELADGYAFHSLMSGRLGAPANTALSAWMDECGADNPLRGVDWLTYNRSALDDATRALWEGAIANFFRSRSKAELASEGRRRGINAAVAHGPGEILDDPQLRARGYFRELVLDDGRRMQVPDFFVQTDRRECRTPPSGPSSAALGAELAAATPIAKQQAAGSPPAAAPSMPAHSTAEPTTRASPGGRCGPRPSPGGQTGSLPLAGVKVLDFSWALVGSLTTKNLADHGAQVIKVESSTRPCLSRIDAQVAVSSSESFDDKPWFCHLNSGKLGLRLNVKHARAREVLAPLIEWADVVVENFSPGTMHKLGLDYATLKQQRADLIMVSGSVYGQTGPRAQDWGIDGTASALSGRLLLTGESDRTPVTPGAVPYGDVVVPLFMAAAVAAALEQRERSGEGRHLDASMVEVCTQQMAEALVMAQIGEPVARSGNHGADMLLQGVYPTRGDDRFIAISLFDVGDLERLTRCMGASWPAAAALTSDDLKTRREALARADIELANLTRQHDGYALMQLLQQHAIAAGVVQDIEDLIERDPQIAQRRALVTAEHPVLGRFGHQVCPYRLSRSEASLRSAPLLGQHTEFICSDILGMSRSHFEALQSDNLFV